jgi:outer membrane protein, heavy metal efflux system
MRTSVLAIAMAPLAVAACAAVPVEAGQDMAARLERDMGARPVWARDEAAQAAVRERVATLLQAPLGAESAVQIALINNPRVEAAFESLGVARADFVDATTPPVPGLHYLALQPEAGGSTVLTYAAGFDLLGLLTLPANARAGAGAQQAARAQATADLLGVAAAARGAWIDYASARQVADLMAQAEEAAGASAAAADALLAAGNIAQLDRDREALFAAEIELASIQAQAAVVPARERLIAALGLVAGDAARVGEVGRLPSPPDDPISIPDLETRVVAASADLAVAAGALEAARANNSVSWLTSILPGLSLEGEREREDGEWKQGAGVSWIAPLFDLGGADRLRRASTARRAEALARAMDIEIRAEARAGLAQAEAARQIAWTRRNVVLPLSTNVFDGAVRDFNAMQIGILDLLRERRWRLEAGRAAIEATADYWHAQARLELLLAGGRATTGVATSRPSGGAPSPDPGH